MERIHDAYSWESQAIQYPETGNPGLGYFKGEMGGEKYVDCYLFRSKDGRLVGILNYYSFDFLPLEAAGNCNIWVKPENHRQRIATHLLDEVRKDYAINFDQQRYTPSGEKFIKKYLKRFG